MFKDIPRIFGTDGVMFSVGLDDGVEDGKLIIVGVKLGFEVLVGFKVSPRRVGLEVVGAWVGREVGCPVGCLVGCPVGWPLGLLLGFQVGLQEGCPEGLLVGCPVGSMVVMRLGCDE